MSGSVIWSLLVIVIFWEWSKPLCKKLDILLAIKGSAKTLLAKDAVVTFCTVSCISSSLPCEFGRHARNNGDIVDDGATVNFQGHKVLRNDQLSGHGSLEGDIGTPGASKRQESGIVYRKVKTVPFCIGEHTTSQR